MTREEMLRNPDYQRILATIDKEVDYVGEKLYSHNIIAMCLLEASEKFGKGVANDLIEEFNLEDLGWEKVNLEEEDI